MVAHMSRLSLNSKTGQPIGHHHQADDEWEDEEEEEETSASFKIGISPELQCALRGNEIIPEKLLSSMPGPNKSGMELVIWRPPGTIVPSEIIASISSNSNSPSKVDASSSRLTLLRDPVLGAQKPIITQRINPNSSVDKNLNNSTSEVGSNDMEMETM